MEGRFTAPIVSHRRWPYGSEGCQAHGFQGFAVALASICGSAAIAWGRYHHYCTRTSLVPLTAGTLSVGGSNRGQGGQCSIQLSVFQTGECGWEGGYMHITCYIHYRRGGRGRVERPALRRSLERLCLPLLQSGFKALNLSILLCEIILKNNL